MQTNTSPKSRDSYWFNTFMVAVGLAVMSTITWHVAVAHTTRELQAKEQRLLPVSSDQGVVVYVPVDRNTVSESVFNRSATPTLIRPEGTLIYVSPFAGSDIKIHLTRDNTFTHVESGGYASTAYHVQGIEHVSIADKGM